VGAYQGGIYKIDAIRRFMRWLDATPHPTVAIEFTPEQVSAARFTRTGSLDGFAVEALPAGALVPSAIETNLQNPIVVKAAVAAVSKTLKLKDEDAALIVPDPVIRVFVQHFDDFPRSAEEAVPMLRWKLKKSVPFEVDETLLSYMRQQPRGEGVDVVTAIARLRIIKEYEALLEEVYPLAAYYQDTWQEGIQAVRVAGLRRRLPEFVRPLEDEFKCDVGSLLNSAVSEGHLRSDARPLADRDLEGLVGWMMHRS
jgi:hypothetical protein